EQETSERAQTSLRCHPNAADASGTPVGANAPLGQRGSPRLARSSDGCQTYGRIGVLRLCPQASAARAGQPMLRFLRIEHLAVIDTLEVEFEAGLNVLTGETGAGKSILVEAVGLLMGGRASPDLIRTGESQA